MIKLKLKMLLVLAIIGIATLFISGICYGANENIVILKNTDNEYLIYIDGLLEKEFKFAFANDKTVDVSTLTFINSGFDTPEAENNIAYVDATTKTLFTNTTYMWIKVGEIFEIKALEVDINDNISKEQLENINNTSNIIPITLDKEQITNEINDNGTKITKTVGIVNLNNELPNGKYQLIKKAENEDTNKLFSLAELIEKNEFLDKYTEIKAAKQFFELKNKLNTQLKTEDWKQIANSKIEQPEETKNGEQYILWIKGEDKDDIHFLTSIREENEEKILEEVQTKLPYTYDNNMVLIALGVVSVLIITVAIRIAVLKKKEMIK